MVEFQAKRTFEAASAKSSKLSAEIEKLDRPLRIAVLGVDCRTITKVVNLIVAERILPVDVGQYAPLRLRFAQQYSIQARDKNGETTRHELEELPSLTKESAGLTIGAPLEALKKIVVFCHAAEDADSLQAAAARSVPFSDLTFLCSNAFGDQEAAFWALLPADLREKGYHFLPLTAEIPGNARKLVDNVFKIDADAAMAAREADSGLDRTAFTESGGMQLISAIRQELKWHEKSIEEAKVALRHGVLDVGNLVSDASSLRVSRNDNKPLQDSGRAPDTASCAARSKKSVAETQIEQIDPVSHPSEGAEFDAEFDSGDFWSNEDAIDWSSEGDRSGPEETLVKEANQEVPE